MARIIFGQDYALTATFTGGSWSSALTLANLQSPAFAAVARSTNVALASTQFQANLGSAQNIGMVAIPVSTLSSAALYRVRLISPSGSLTVADSGWLALVPSAAVISPLAPGGGVSTDAPLYPPVALYLPPGGISGVAQYVLIELDDRTNPAGYIDVGRVVVAANWQPARNAEYGASITHEDTTVVQPAWGGGEFFDIRPKRRVVRLNVGALPDAEANQLALDMQRRLGVSGQLFFVWDADDLANRHRRSFLCRMRTLSPLISASFGANNQSFELSEVIA